MKQYIRKQSKLKSHASPNSQENKYVNNANETLY